MTETEAKEKACCGAVASAWAVIATAYAAQGHAELVPDVPQCRASACMAWRSRATAPVARIEYGDIENWTRAGWNVALSKPDLDGTYTASMPEHGYCGLAGRLP